MVEIGFVEFWSKIALVFSQHALVSYPQPLSFNQKHWNFEEIESFFRPAIYYSKCTKHRMNWAVFYSFTSKMLKIRLVLKLMHSYHNLFWTENPWPFWANEFLTQCLIKSLPYGPLTVENKFFSSFVTMAKKMQPHLHPN